MVDFDHLGYEISCCDSILNVMKNFVIINILTLNITWKIYVAGCKVVIASRNLERLTQAAESLEHIGEIKPMQCNIRKEADVK